MIKEFENYLNKRGVKGNWKLPALKCTYKYILVIPVLNELEAFPLLLKSLRVQSKSLLKETLVVAVINNSEEAPSSIRQKNQNLDELIKEKDFGFEICVVDAYSPGLELPVKHAGVGLARKIGMDLSIPFAHETSVFGCLDADVILSPSYLARLQELNSKKVSAAVLSFEHQNIKSVEIISEDGMSAAEEAQKAIIEYEDFLKTTAIQLEKIKSPYGYVPLGSAMYCSVKAYVAVGGMPKKKAAEDFYFLQALSKYCGVKSEVFEDPIVFPSSRESDRAYLGTGYRMIQANQGFDMKSLNYNPIAFSNLGLFLEIVLLSRGVDPEVLKEKVKLKVPMIYEPISKEGFWEVWSGFSQIKNEKQFVGQFHKWFDGLKTLRCLKALS